MVGQSGIGSTSVATAVTQRYRDAASIQVQRETAKTREFASALPSQPSVIATVSGNAVTLSPSARLAPEAVVPAKPVNRSVLASPALAKRGTAAYGAAASLADADADADSAALASSTSPGTGLNLDC